MKKQDFLTYCMLLGFILGIKGGRIALWKGSQLIESYPVRAEFLPKADQIMLKDGIYIGSRAELAGILEDYLS